MAKTGKKPKAIIPVHLYGMPARWQSILDIADHYQIPVVEDAAEALGSKIGEQYAGTFGRLGVFSFNGNKIITTSGGGALLSDEKKLIDHARFLATQAGDSAPHYQHSTIGYNYRLSNISAGIGRGQMEVLDKRIQQKRTLFRRYFERLEGSWFIGENDDTSLGISGIQFLKESDNSYSNRSVDVLL
ncbi:MAG: DegT/DnrJ/EryC1/StrS family aminotransferase [Balneolaceae bacterium]|nr:DegT/DnrJ/EryC1/StrS family aminotransferase [Balneolaceae bacterium]